MDIIALDKVDNLLWLGRYSERVYSTIKEFFIGYDKMIEQPDFYIKYCANFKIPNIYCSTDDFVKRYLKDETDPDSIISNLYRAYDNCMILRNEIGTQTMSYLELAVNDLVSLKDFDSFIIDLQSILDHILAFWASLDDEIENYEVRSIVKLGRRLERLDIYLYLHKDRTKLVKAYDMLEHRLNNAYIPYNKEAFVELKNMLFSPSALDYDRAITLTESLI